MRHALLIGLFLAACLLFPAAARADCSALVSPTRDNCLRVELGLAESAARTASDTLLARLDPPARPALVAEQRWSEPEFRLCRALSQIRRNYKADETRRAAICIADMQDQASGRLEWLTALELGRPQSGIHTPRAGWRPADYQLIARHGLRFLLLIWSPDPDNVCADGMLTVLRRANGGTGWAQIGPARAITIECPRFGSLLTPDRRDYPDFAITGEAEGRLLPVTRYFTLSDAGVAEFPINLAYLGNDSPQITVVASKEDPIVWAWASGDGIQMPVYYRLRAGYLMEACGKQQEAYREIVRDASEDWRSTLAAIFAHLQLGEHDKALKQLRETGRPDIVARVSQEIGATWADAQAHDCRLAAIWDRPEHRVTAGLGD